MSKETLQFRCPVCGLHSPVDNLTAEEQFAFEVFRRVLGGKLKRTEAEKILLKGTKPKPGSGHGLIRYTSQGTMGRDIYLSAMIHRLETALERCRAPVRESEKRG